jgi:hypothetical protein
MTPCSRKPDHHPHETNRSVRSNAFKDAASKPLKLSNFKPGSGSASVVCKIDSTNCSTCVKTGGEPGFGIVTQFCHTELAAIIIINSFWSYDFNSLQISERYLN